MFAKRTSRRPKSRVRDLRLLSSHAPSRLRVTQLFSVILRFGFVSDQFHWGQWPYRSWRLPSREQFLWTMPRGLSLPQVPAGLVLNTGFSIPDPYSA